MDNSLGTYSREKEHLRMKNNFMNVMNCLFRGDVDKKNLKDIEGAGKTSEKTKKEVYDLLKNYYYAEEDDNINLQISSHTTNFKHENKETLKELGIGVNKKYIIKDYNNYFNITPDIYIKDTEKFTNFLKSFKELPVEIDDETQTDILADYIEYALFRTANEIDKRILDENIDITNDEYVMNFFLECKELDKECTRLQIRERTFNNELRNYMTARKEKCLDKYISFRRLGFVAELHEELDTIPSFMNDMIKKDNDSKRMEEIERKYKDIEKAITLLEEVKDNKTIFDPLSTELQRGLYQTIQQDGKGKLNKHIRYRLMDYIDRLDNLIDRELGFTEDLK